MPEFLPEWRVEFEGSIVHPRLYPLCAMMFMYGLFTPVDLAGQPKKGDGARPMWAEMGNDSVGWVPGCYPSVRGRMNHLSYTGHQTSHHQTP